MTTVVWSDAEAIRARLEQELERLLERLRTLAGIQQVWIAGSLVDGRVHATSDLDLVVVRLTREGPVDRGLTLRRELAAKVPIDVFVYTPEEAAAGGRFIDGVRRRGRRLL